MKLPSLCLLPTLGLLAASVSKGQPTASPKAKPLNSSSGPPGLSPTLRNSGNNQNYSVRRASVNLTAQIGEFSNTAEKYCNQWLVTDAIGNDTKSLICGSVGKELYSAATVAIENKDTPNNNPSIDALTYNSVADIQDAGAYIRWAAESTGTDSKRFIEGFTDENAASALRQQFDSKKLELIEALEAGFPVESPGQMRTSLALDAASDAAIYKAQSRAGQKFLTLEASRPRPSATATSSPSATPTVAPDCTPRNQTSYLFLTHFFSALAGGGTIALTAYCLAQQKKQGSDELAMDQKSMSITKNNDFQSSV